MHCIILPMLLWLWQCYRAELNLLSCLTQALVILTTGLVCFPMGKLCCPGSWWVLSPSSPSISLMPMLWRVAISRRCYTIVQVRLFDTYLESKSNSSKSVTPHYCIGGKLGGNLVIRFSKCNQRFALTFKDRNKPFISYQILCEMTPSAVYKCSSLWDEDVWMLLTVTIMLFSKMDRRNATSKNSLDPSCQLPLWRVDTIGWFRKGCTYLVHTEIYQSCHKS